MSRRIHAFCAMNLTCSGHDKEDIAVPLSVFLLELCVCVCVYTEPNVVINDDFRGVV